MKLSCESHLDMTPVSTASAWFLFSWIQVGSELLGSRNVQNFQTDPPTEHCEELLTGDKFWLLY